MWHLNGWVGFGGTLDQRPKNTRDGKVLDALGEPMKVRSDLIGHIARTRLIL